MATIKINLFDWKYSKNNYYYKPSGSIWTDAHSALSISIASTRTTSHRPDWPSSSRIGSKVLPISITIHSIWRNPSTSMISPSNTLRTRPGFRCGNPSTCTWTSTVIRNRLDRFVSCFFKQIFFKFNFI